MSFRPVHAIYPALAVAVSIGIFVSMHPSHAMNQAAGNSAQPQQSQPSANAPAQRGQAGRGARGFGPPSLKYNFSDHTGFTQIFDGKDLKGWDGAPQIWKVENGAIVGQSTTASPAGTTFLIYRGSSPADFDLKIEMRMTGQGNSGIQYRSRNAQPEANFFANRGGAARGAAPAAGTAAGGNAQTQAAPNAPAAGAPGGGAPTQAGRAAPAAAGARRGGFSMQAMNRFVKWNMQGYQFDEDPNGTGSGNLWEGGRFPGERGTVASIGQIVQLQTSGPNVLLATVAPAATVASWWHKDDWNQEEIVARGNVLTHLINGHIITETIDDNTAKRVTHGGLIGIQVESGGDFTVMARDIWLKVIH